MLPLSFLGFTIAIRTTLPDHFGGKAQTRSLRSMKLTLLRIRHLPIKAQASYLNSILRGQRGRANWIEMNKILNKYPLTAAKLRFRTHWDLLSVRRQQAF